MGLRVVLYCLNEPISRYIGSPNWKQKNEHFVLRSCFKFTRCEKNLNGGPKYGVYFCVVYDFKQGKTAVESYRSCATHLEGKSWAEANVVEGPIFSTVVTKALRRAIWSSHFFVDGKALKTTIVRSSTILKVLTARFRCTHITTESYLLSNVKLSLCRKWELHQLSGDNLRAWTAIRQVLLQRARNRDFIQAILTSFLH